MKMLLSACLLGSPVRYDGKAKKLQQSELAQLISEGRVLGFCPEVAGGLDTPRAPAEIQAGDATAVLTGKARVVTVDGSDVSAQFLEGARLALAFCLANDVSIAVLTESSPSCGSNQVYDGNFSRNPIPGEGVTTALLRQQGIHVYNQEQLAEAIEHFKSLSG